MRLQRASTYAQADQIRPTTQAAQAAHLPGRVAITRHATSASRTSSGPDLNARPSTRDLAAILLAEELAHDILSSGFPASLDEQARTLTHYLQALTPRHAGTGLDRRGPMFAEAAARHLLTWEHPSHLEFTPRNHLRKWYAELCGELDDAGSGPAAAFAGRAGFAVSFVRRPRVVWTHPDGPGRGLLLDRVYTASRAGVIERDRWVAGKVASDLRDMADYLAPLDDLDGPGAARRAILGVRVISHRAPNAGVHFVPAFTTVTDADGRDRDLPLIGSHHRVGGCQWCAPAARLPLATPTSTRICVSDLVVNVVDNNLDIDIVKDVDKVPGEDLDKARNKNADENSESDVDESKRSNTNKNMTTKKNSTMKTKKKKPMRLGIDNVGVTLVKDQRAHLEHLDHLDHLDQGLVSGAGDESVSA
ncbi:hypothetical protein GCM10009867_17050 [Pedococcus aerophilus]|uniref:Uncharacterized protein n=1 Tax=Pedococcus aerophilus TaxID=436356 RepID=A0ABP6H4B7_9MICO